MAKAVAALALWRQGLAAVEQAEGVAAAGEAGPATRQRLAELRAEFEAATAVAGKAAQLLADLDGARLQVSQMREGRWDWDAAAAAYAKAFQRYGIDVPALEPEAAARLLEQCPAALQTHFLLALDFWAICDPARAGQLLQVAKQRNTDPWRRRLRSAVEGRDLAQLRKLADEARQAAVPAAGVELLARALIEGKAVEEAVALLREAQQCYPGDFWINYGLGTLLVNDLRQAEEAVGYFRAALAVCPQSAPAHSHLGVALADKKNLEGAIRHYRAALDIDPKLAPGPRRFGTGAAGARPVHRRPRRNPQGLRPASA